jgi:hypothetical protein
MSNFMNIRPGGAEVFQSDGQTDKQKDGRTDMTNLIVAFRNFAKAPKRGRVSLILKQISLCLCRLTRPPARLFVDFRLRKAKIEYLMLSLVHTYPGRQVVGEIKLCNGMPTCCGSTALHLHHVTILAPILLK